MRKSTINNSVLIVLISLIITSCSKNNPGATEILSGSTWVVTRVDFEATNTSQVFTDTISFINTEQYIHNQITNSYRIGNYNSEQKYYLLWENCVIFSDDVEANLNPDIIDQGLLNGIEFNKLLNNNSIYVWMHRIY